MASAAVARNYFKMSIKCTTIIQKEYNILLIHAFINLHVIDRCVSVTEGWYRKEVEYVWGKEEKETQI